MLVEQTTNDFLAEFRRLFEDSDFRLENCNQNS